MTEYRNIKASGEKSSYRDVPSPAKTDGVGVALRRAFAMTGPPAEDFDGLLRELDNRTR